MPAPFTETAAIARFPDLARLRDLCAAHWTFFPHHADNGIDQLRGVKVWPTGHADALLIRAERDTAAVRCHPDGGLIWQRDGTFADVLAALVDLPVPTASTAPALVIGAGPRLWTPEW